MIIHCFKTDKILGEVIKFIEKTMENCKVDLTAGGKSLTEMKIQRGIFQREAISLFIFVIMMMPLNHILWKCTGENKLNGKKN